MPEAVVFFSSCGNAVTRITLNLWMPYKEDVRTQVVQVHSSWKWDFSTELKLSKRMNVCAYLESKLTKEIVYSLLSSKTDWTVVSALCLSQWLGSYQCSMSDWWDIINYLYFLMWRDRYQCFVSFTVTGWLTGFCVFEWWESCQCSVF